MGGVDGEGEGMCASSGQCVTYNIKGVVVAEWVEYPLPMGELVGSIPC